MQKLTLSRLGRRLSEACVLLALPAFALVTFSPRALGTLGQGLPRAHAVAVLSAAQPAAAAELTQWADTASNNPITVNLVQQARNESAALNNAVRSLRAQIIQASQHNPGSAQTTFSVAFLLQSLDLIASERNSWDSTWRQIGRPGSDQTFVQNRLVNLQVSYVNANALLVSFQGSEVQVSSISTFTAPAF